MTRRDALGVLGVGAVLAAAFATRDALGRCPAGTTRTEYGCRAPCGPGNVRQGSRTDACLPPVGAPPAPPPATPSASG